MILHWKDHTVLNKCSIAISENVFPTCDDIDNVTCPECLLAAKKLIDSRLSKANALPAPCCECGGYGFKPWRSSPPAILGATAARRDAQRLEASSMRRSRRKVSLKLTLILLRRYQKHWRRQDHRPSEIYQLIFNEPNRLRRERLEILYDLLSLGSHEGPHHSYSNCSIRILSSRTGHSERRYYRVARAYRISGLRGVFAKWLEETRRGLVQLTSLERMMLHRRSKP